MRSQELSAGVVWANLNLVFGAAEGSLMIRGWKEWLGNVATPGGSRVAVPPTKKLSSDGRSTLQLRHHFVRDVGRRSP